jgi:tRNA (guanine10-N2)-methyltransferase
LDLLNLASTHLEINGRIAFWFPVLKATYSEDVLPRHDALEMLENCEQSLTNKGSR